MICPALGASVPFMTTVEVLEKVPLGSEASSEALFLNWFMDLKEAGFQTLLCPDILYPVLRGRDDFSEATREAWLSTASHLKVQAVTLKRSEHPEATFSCSEVGLKCSPQPLQEERKLLPWCCIKSYAHILAGEC